MQCPLCKTELRVKGCKTLVTPDYLVYREQELVCRNRRCEKYDSVVETVRHEIRAEKTE